MSGRLCGEKETARRSDERLTLQGTLEGTTTVPDPAPGASAGCVRSAFSSDPDGLRTKRLMSAAEAATPAGVIKPQMLWLEGQSRTIPQ